MKGKADLWKLHSQYFHFQWTEIWIKWEGISIRIKNFYKNKTKESLMNNTKLLNWYFIKNLHSILQPWLCFLCVQIFCKHQRNWIWISQIENQFEKRCIIADRNKPLHSHTEVVCARNSRGLIQSGEKNLVVFWLAKTTYVFNTYIRMYWHRKNPGV